jgi:uncharacterized protein (TIGR00369 family)
VDPDARAALLVDLFERAPLGEHLGMALGFDDRLRSVVDLPPGRHLHHPLHQVHGGVFGTLVDTAAWFAAAIHYDTWIATVEYHTRLLEPVADEALVAVGRLIRAGNRLATASAEIHTASGDLVAIGTGSFAVTDVPIA